MNSTTAFTGTASVNVIVLLSVSTYAEVKRCLIPLIKIDKLFEAGVYVNPLKLKIVCPVVAVATSRSFTMLPEATPCKPPLSCLTVTAS